MPINQQQIADALGLSIITVSRALRDHPDLAGTTKQRVLQKARELGYAKTKTKPAAAPGTPRRAGILLYEPPQAAKRDTLASGVKRAIFLALQKECQRLEVETMIETPASNEVPLLVKNRTINTAFIFGRYTADTIAGLGKIPAIAVSSFIDCAGLPRIVADNLNGMRLSTEHLIELGHRNILFVGLADPHTRLFEERADGYVAAMHRRGLAPVVKFCDDFASLPPVEEIRAYSAVACASDALAYALHIKLTAAGVKLPHECSLAAFDNLPTEYPHPVTTYAPDWELMGKMAADLLLSHPLDVQGQDIVVTVPGKMLLRGSTVPYPST